MLAIGENAAIALLALVAALAGANECVSCGKPGQPCCAGDYCVAGGKCGSDKMCGSCGGLNEQCCSGGTCAAANTRCEAEVCKPLIRCNDAAKAGTNNPETISVEMGQSSGTTTLRLNTYENADDITVSYAGQAIVSTGCYGSLSVPAGCAPGVDNNGNKFTVCCENNDR